MRREGGGAAGDQARLRVLGAAVGPPARTLPAVPPKYKPCLFWPYPAPTPRLQQPPRTLVRAEAAAVQFRPVRGRGLPPAPPGPFPPLLLRGPLYHSRIGFRLPAAAAGGRSPVLEGDQQPGVQDVLLGFPRVISCKRKGRGTPRKKPSLRCGLQVGNDIRPYSVFMNHKLFSCGCGGWRVDFCRPDTVPETPPQVKINTQGQEGEG